MSERNQIIKSGFTFYEDLNNEYSGLFRYKKDKAEYLWTLGPVTSLGVTVEGGYYGLYKCNYGESVKHGYLGFTVLFYRDLNTGKFLGVDYANMSIYFDIDIGHIGAWTYSKQINLFKKPDILLIYLDYLIKYYIAEDERAEKYEAFKELIKDSKYQREDRLDVYGSLFITDKGLINENTISTLYRDLGISVEYYDSFLKYLNKFWEDNIPEEWLPGEETYFDFRFDSEKEIDPSLNTFVFEISNKDIKHGFTNENSTLTAYDYDYDNKYIGEVYIKKNTNDNYKLKITPDDIPIEWTLNEDFRLFVSLEIDLLTNKDLYGLTIFNRLEDEDILGPAGLWKKFTLEINLPILLRDLFLNKYYAEHFESNLTRTRNNFCFYNLTNDINRIITNDVIFSVNNNIVKTYKVRYDFRNNDVNEFYVNVLNFLENQVFRVGETKTIDIQFRLPTSLTFDKYTDSVLISKNLHAPNYFQCFTLGLAEGEEDPFNFSYSFDFNIIEEYDDGYSVEGVVEGTTTITINCKHKNFTSNNKIYIGLAPYVATTDTIDRFVNLGSDHLPYDEISYLSEFYIDIPEGTKFEIFNDRIDVLDLNVLGTLYDDDIYYEYEFVNNEDFSKRLVEPIITFEDWNTKLRIDVMGQDSDLRTDSVFYNLTDHDFEGLLKLWIKAVNGLPVDNDYYEIPVVYHKETEHNFTLRNSSITIGKDKEEYVNLLNVFTECFGVGNLRTDSQKAADIFYIKQDNHNIFKNAPGRFENYGQTNNILLNEVYENATVSNKQTKLMIYPYFEGITGNEDFLNDREMFPSVLLTITLESVSLSDPFVNDDRYEEGNGDTDVIRLNNFVSTPITNNKYSVNMTSRTKDGYVNLKLTDKLYFLEASPVYVNQSVKEVTLHYEYKSLGNLYVTFLNQDAYIPCIQDVILNTTNKTVTVKLIQNRNQTSQGYISLYDGNIGVKIGIFLTYGK